MEGFSPVSPPRIFWNSRKRSATVRSLENSLNTENLKTPVNKQIDPANNETMKVDSALQASEEDQQHKEDPQAELSERRKALFQPLEPTNGRRTPNEILLPPPDFDSTMYPKGWLVGKKRKLVNVDVVESMRRIAIQELNRKEREIDGLNEQLEGDARCLEHLQLQLLEERSKRAEVQRENAMLQDQISMLMGMLEETENINEDDAPTDP